MAYLFEIVEKKAFPKTEVLLIEPFKTIWERDKSLKKETALKELTYIEFLTSYKNSNPYKEYTKELRDEILKKELFNKNWKPDVLILKAIDKIIEFQTNGSKIFKLYLASMKAIENLSVFLNNSNLQEKNIKTGNYLLKPRDITSALKDTNDLRKSFEELSKKIFEELEDKDITNRAGKVISKFSKIDNFDV